MSLYPASCYWGFVDVADVEAWGAGVFVREAFFSGFVARDLVLGLLLSPVALAVALPPPLAPALVVAVVAVVVLVAVTLEVRFLVVPVSPRDCDRLGRRVFVSGLEAVNINIF